MKLDGSQIMQQSYMGAFFTFLMWLIVAVFVYTKAITVILKDEVDIMSALVEYGIDHNYKFSTDQGFFIAAALTEYDRNTEIIEEPEKYGELVIEHHGWDYVNKQSESYERTQIKSHYCSDEELGFVRSPDTLIYPITPNSIPEVQTYKKKFKCLNKEDMVIWGDYNSHYAQ